MNKVALVTGASGEIGRAIATTLSQDGYFVLIHYYQNEKGALQTSKQIKELNGSSQIIQFDLKNSEKIIESLDHFFKENPDKILYCLINNAGIVYDSLSGMMSDEMLDQVIKTNLYSAFYLQRYAIRKMIRLKEGVIINISSLAGQTGNPGQINYSASKAGLIAMTKTLAMELGRRKIRVNAVAPGIIESLMTKNIEGLESYRERIPLGRFGQAKEVANAVSFLASDKSSYITGHTINVNGGLYPV